jgi:hypothetical protein
MTVNPALYGSTLTALEEVARQAIAHVEGAQTSQQKLERAAALLAVLQVISNKVAELRSAAAIEIHDAEGLSLSKLADRAGISKARAGQIVQQAKREG